MTYAHDEQRPADWRPRVPDAENYHERPEDVAERPEHEQAATESTPAAKSKPFDAFDALVPTYTYPPATVSPSVIELTTAAQRKWAEEQQPPKTESASDELAEGRAEYEAAAKDAEDNGIALPRVHPNLVIDSEPALRLVVGARQDCELAVQHIREQAQAMIDAVERYKDWLDRRFEPQMRAYVKHKLAGSKTKSLKLMTGHSAEPARVGFRKVKGGLRITDPDKVVEWALRRENYVDMVAQRTVFKPIAEKVKQYFAETGEVPPGCEVKPDEETFYVK